MYADVVTRSIESAIGETQRRRELQQAFNEKHGIVPKTIVKDIRDVIEISTKEDVEYKTQQKLKMSKQERLVLIDKLTKQMKEAAKLLDFEHAAFLRDKIKELRGED